MSGDQFNLDAIEARARDATAAIFAGDLVVIQRGAAQRLAREDVPALVAEVRRLRALEASLVEERDTYPEPFDTGEPNPLMPGRTRRDTRPRTDRRFVTAWEQVE